MKSIENSELHLNKISMCYIAVNCPRSHIKAFSFMSIATANFVIVKQIRFSIFFQFKQRFSTTAQALSKQAKNLQKLQNFDCMPYSQSEGECLQLSR